MHLHFTSLPLTTLRCLWWSAVKKGANGAGGQVFCTARLKHAVNKAEIGRDMVSWF